MARCASFLTCLCLFGAGSTGCRAPAHPVIKRRYVRLEALLPLHPAWRQLQLLRHESAGFGAVHQRPDRVTLDLPALPSNFSPPPTIPASRIKERQERLAEEAIQRVTRDADQLNAGNEAKFRSEERAARAEVNAAYQRKLNDRLAAIRQERESEAAALQKQIDHLGFRVVALQTQLNAYGDQASQARDDALLQRDRLTRQVTGLDAERLQKLDNKSMLAEATASMADALKQMNRALEDRLMARRKQLDQEAADKIAQFKDRLAQRRDTIPSIGSIPPPPQYLHETPLPFPTRSETLAAIASAQGGVDRETVRQQAGWQTQQEHLIDTIRADTKQAVEQIAQQQGWTWVAEGVPGAQDGTEAAAKALRAQWQNDAVRQ